VHDPLFYQRERGFFHSSNHAGGVEGGISNGEPLHIRIAMKPIPTLYKPLQTVDLDTKQAAAASVERSDTCAVPAAAVVAEAMVCWVLAEAMLEKFGGDSLAEVQRNLGHYLEQMMGGVVSFGGIPMGNDL
ncbi:chorismate synthase, partial [Mycobacterium tuberculosis]|uniref:chorismate synthase n=1 Tax=Mycobacterium tuberculosis TaxID=1773 RepID=UPI000A7B3A8A